MSVVKDFCGFQSYSNGNQNSPQTVKVLNITFGDEKPTYGANIARWREVIRNRQNATTTLSYSGLWYKRGSPGSLSVQYARKTVEDGRTVLFRIGCEGMGSMAVATSVTPTAPIISTTHANNVALRRFMSNVIEVQRSFQGGVFLGEIRQVVRLIRNPAAALFGSITNFPKTIASIAQRETRRIPKKKRLAYLRRRFSETYLEAVFGWRPLISDINGAIEAAYNISNDYRHPKIVGGKGYDARERGLIHDTAGFPYASVVRTYHRFDEVNVRYYGSVVPSTGLTGASRQVGLSLPDVLPTLWELVPFSFVVDYFSNVGAVIEAVSRGNAGIAWVSRGIFHRSSIEFISAQFSPIHPGSTYFNTRAFFQSPSGYKISRGTKSRGPYLGSLVPSIEFRLPLTSSLSTNFIRLGSLLSILDVSRGRISNALRR